MKLSAHVLSFAMIDKKGIRSAKTFFPWESDQKGPEDIRRAQVLSSPYPSFGKLNLPDKFLFCVASLLLENIGKDTVVSGDKSGICIGLPFGSLSTDLRYMESVRNGFPSPAVFSATLPSSPVAEAAITYKFKGT